jgi:hypothetical protein
MSNETQAQSTSSGLDMFIKVLTILKLFLQVSLYGLILGGTLWFLLANPLPKLMEDIQAKVISSLLQQPGR